MLDGDKPVEALLVLRLQQFHNTLGMLWTLAESANCPRDFNMMVVSMEILMAAELLSLPPGFGLTLTLGMDVLP